MPSKKKKYNARFPAGRIKKIMQTDEEVGKVAQAVPVIISRTLELFVGSLLTKSMQITQSRNAKTLTPSHMKQCILSENRFDFLKDLVKNIPDASIQEDNENNAIFEANIVGDNEGGPNPPKPTPEHNSTEQSSSSTRTPVIQYGPKVVRIDAINNKRFTSFSVDSLIQDETSSSTAAAVEQPKVRITIDAETVPVPPLVPTRTRPSVDALQSTTLPTSPIHSEGIPPLIPLSNNVYTQNTEDNLCIDEDYDN